MLSVEVERDEEANATDKDAAEVAEELVDTLEVDVDVEEIEESKDVEAPTTEGDGSVVVTLMSLNARSLWKPLPKSIMFHDHAQVGLWLQSPIFPSVDSHIF